MNTMHVAIFDAELCKDFRNKKPRSTDYLQAADAGSGFPLGSHDTVKQV